MVRTRVFNLFMLLACMSLPFSSVMAKPFYKPDLSHLENSQIYEEWQRLTQEADDNGLTKANIIAKIKIIEPIVDAKPQWADGKWLLANLYLNLGETASSDDEDSKKEARAQLVKAQKLTEDCLRINPNIGICKFFLGAAIGKISTIDGIFSSLGKGERVLNLWLDLKKSKQDYVFDDGYSLQGLNYYALGIFYRVVPESRILKWLFGISGDIEQSIAMHKESVKRVGGNGACGQFMLAVAQLCYADVDEPSEVKSSLKRKFRAIGAMKSDSDSSKICINDARKMLKSPGNACGYTKAQQQKRSEDDPEY
ncbi:MAG: hypothetical protein HRU19_23840 [Pseudobacteriovorax sp.]|nr:hypothetical protein [Pseudobacteriovorax sp.]